MAEIKITLIENQGFYYSGQQLGGDVQITISKPKKVNGKYFFHYLQTL